MSHGASGGCLCGAVRFRIATSLPAPDICHCRECRRWSGHCFASADVPKAAVTVDGATDLAWYASSLLIRRGFRRRCGASLFWEPVDRGGD